MICVMYSPGVWSKDEVEGVGLINGGNKEREETGGGLSAVVQGLCLYHAQRHHIECLSEPPRTQQSTVMLSWRGR